MRRRTRLQLVAWGLACLAAGCGGAETNAQPDASDASVPDAGPPAVGCADCLVLSNGKIFDGTQSRTGVVVLRGERIEEVVFGEAQITAGEVVDLAGKTVLPGLLDLHVHSMAEAAPHAYMGDKPQQDAHLKAMLRAGVTAYLDLGTQARRIFAYRERVATGALTAPQIFAAGPLITAPGGHPCYHGSPVRGLCILVDLPADAAQLKTELWPHKPDLAKLVIEGGSAAWPLPRISKPAIAAVAAEAKAQGVEVVAHVSTAQDMIDALDGGVRRFAHLPAEDQIPASLAGRLAAEQAVVIPTLAVFEALYLLSHDKLALDETKLKHDVPQAVLAALQDPSYLADYTSSSYRAWTQQMWDNVQANFAACRKAGVRMVAGTDAGNPATFHGLALQREVELYVQLGMEPAEALVAATEEAAGFIGASDLGRLVAGRLANLLVVEGDPLQRIADLRQVSAVYLRGRALDRTKLSVAGSESLVVQPTQDQAEGDVCLAQGECAADLVCDLWSARCTASCDATTGQGCSSGSACFAESQSSSVGYCLLGDGCDLFAQDCENGAACVWLGNAATSCWYASEQKAGESCGASSTCAPGFQCNYYTGSCYRLCHPTDPTQGPCDPGQSCTDLSQLAGMPAGQCS